MKKITLLDIIVCFIFIISLIIISYFGFFNNSNKSSFLIVQTKINSFYYSINQKKIIKIKGELGITTIEINNGKFRFIDSPCINKICINYGWDDKPNLPIICMPNNVSAYIESSQNNEKYDGITQ